VYRLCLVLLVVLSGCAGLGVDSADDRESTETVDPVPVPEADRETTRSSGINASGVSDPEMLADAHGDWLSERSYTLISNQTVRYENGDIRSQYRSRLLLGEDRAYLVTVRTRGSNASRIVGEPPAVSRYYSDGDVYVRAYGDPPTEFNEFTPSRGVGTWSFWARSGAFSVWTSPEELFERSFESIPTEVETRRVVDGVRRYRVVDTGDNDAALSFPEAESARGRLGATGDHDAALPFPEAEPAQNVSLVADIDETGLVRRFELEYRGEIDGEPVVVSRTIAYTDVDGTEVERPEWFEKAT
jgi:hypothetical protein